MPDLHERASRDIWPAQGPADRPRSWNTCEASTRFILATVYDDPHYVEGDRVFGGLRFEDPAIEDLASADAGHFWAEIPVDDLKVPVVADLTPAQTGFELPWICDTYENLAAMGLHYAAGRRMPYFNTCFDQ